MGTLTPPASRARLPRRDAPALPRTWTRGLHKSRFSGQHVWNTRGDVVNLSAQTPEAIMAQKTVPAAALQTCRDLGEALAEGLATGVV